jgi:hypothetical protein
MPPLLSKVSHIVVFVAVRPPYGDNEDAPAPTGVRRLRVSNVAAAAAPVRTSFVAGLASVFTGR